MKICYRCNGCGWDNPAQAIDVCPVCNGSGGIEEMHIMLDLETWGKKPGCDIRSIGACVFNPLTNFVHDGSLGTFKPFYIATDNPFVEYDDRIGGSYAYSLTRDPDTVEWWLKQSLEAQSAFENPVDLREACIQFASWINNMNPATPPGHATNVRIWANGPQFDISILEAVFDAVGLPVPWHYRAPRDFRTITDAANMSFDDYSNYGDAHNALHDAIAQSMTVCEAYKRLGLQR